jgi:hypothetical protein
MKTYGQRFLMAAGLLLACLGVFASQAHAQGGVPLWTNRYNYLGVSSSWDQVYAIAVDSSGNVFVTGRSDTAFATVAYSSAGEPLWTNRGAIGSAMAVDTSGNVFITGGISGGGGNDFLTIKYSNSGMPLWTNRYDSGLSPSSIAVDRGGRVFVTGAAQAATYSDFATVVYSNSGLPLWTNRYHGPNAFPESAVAIAADSNGNVFVTGQSGGTNGDFDYATVAYSNTGEPLWTNRYNGPGNGDDIPCAIAVDSNGNVFVTGESVGAQFSDYATIKYSGAGVPLWTNRYSNGATGAARAHTISVDGSGNVFVTGQSYTGGNGADYATVAYSNAGVPLWTNWYNGGNGGIANALAVDSAGNVFVTGTSAGAASGSSGYATVAYSHAGVPLWTNLYIGPEYAEEAVAIAVDGSGNVIVAGTSAGTNGSVFYYDTDYATIKYSSSLPPPVSLMIDSDGSGGYFIWFTGIPGSTYRLQRATDLAGPWLTSTSLTAPASGLVEFHDLFPPSSRSFYRTVQP